MTHTQGPVTPFLFLKSNRDTPLFSSKQDQDRQKQLAQQRSVTWQQKDKSELNKVKEQLNTLETGTKPEAVSSTNMGALQVRKVITQ